MRRKAHAVLPSLCLLCLFFIGCEAEIPPPDTAAGMEETAETSINTNIEKSDEMIKPLQIYPVPACYSLSEQASATVNGEELPIIRAHDEYDYASFAFTDPVSVTIDIGENIKTATVSPKAKNIPFTTEGSRITITMEKPEYLIVKLNGKREIVLLADPPETDVPADSGEGIYNIAALGADATGKENATPILQQAIDDATEAGGGTVYVPAGVYGIGNVRLRSNVTLYLAPGAVLQATQQDSYKEFCRRTVGDTEFPTTYLLYTNPGAKNVKICGRGTIDARGYAQYQEKSWLVCGFVPNRCTDLTLDGVIVRDTGHWGTIIVYSKGVTITNTKHLNKPSTLGQNDGIDIVGSSDVTVTRTIALCRDDPYSVKTYTSSYMFEGAGRTAENIVFDDCFAWTRCGAFKLGWGISTLMANITFKNSYVYNCNNGLLVTHYDGTATVRDITFENIDIEGFQLADSKWLLIDIGLSKPGASRRGWGRVNGVTVRNINVRAPWQGVPCIYGHSEILAVKGVDISGITIRGQKCSSLASMGVKTNDYAYEITVTE